MDQVRKEIQELRKMNAHLKHLKNSEEYFDRNETQEQEKLNEIAKKVEDKMNQLQKLSVAKEHLKYLKKLQLQNLELIRIRVGTEFEMSNEHMDEIIQEQGNLTKSEIIRFENSVTSNTNETIFSHFYVHIPKTAGGGVFGMLKTLMKDIYSTKNWVNDACYMGVEKIERFTMNLKEQKSGAPCNFWMTEDRLSNSKYHRHAYTVIRSPKEHVLSQYFHCKESRDHRGRAHLMPTLDKWLDHHLQQRMGKENISLAQYRSGGRFKCYDPINLQTYMTGFNSSMDEHDLRKKFDVIGDMNQLGKSVCALSIRYMGLLSPRCDCTNSGDSNRRLIIDHGVQHHGATFNLTISQALKIEKLTQLDHLLYDRTKEAFKKQVAEIENEMGIILCQNPKF